jgi:hypothetical protein
MFQTKNEIRDFVIPVCRLDQSLEEKYQGFLGTGFFIGQRGFLLTAAHVVRNIPQENLGIMLVGSDDNWYGFNIELVEFHPYEDIAILKSSVDFVVKTPFLISEKWEGSSRKYEMFGYPSDTLLDLSSENGQRPDLIYYSGYIRRRISFPLLSIKSRSMFELSEFAEPGCSGSPMYVNEDGIWRTIGIYAGHRYTESSDAKYIVSYAVRAESIYDWIPKMLGHTVQKESLNLFHGV